MMKRGLAVALTLVVFLALTPPSASSANGATAVFPSLATIQSMISGELPLKTLPHVTDPPTASWTHIFDDYGPAPISPNMKSCWAIGRSAVTTPNCPFGDAKSKKLMILTGDSQMWMWVPAIADWASRNNWRVEVYAKGSCPPWPDKYQLWFDHSAYPQCAQFQKFTESQINLQRPAVVIAAGLRPVWPTSHCFNCDSKATVGALQGDVKSFVRSISASGARVVFLQPSPNFYAIGSTVRMPPYCLSRETSNIALCNNIPFDQLRDYWWSLAFTPQSIPAGTAMIMQNQLLCAKDKCPMVVGSTLVYVDADHVSLQWAEFVSKGFGQILAPLISNLK